MPNYRRNRVPGGCYFFTVTLRDRTSELLVSRIDRLRDAVRQTRAVAPFRIDAWVVMPDHMHCVWTLPEGDWDFPKRWQAIKASFSKSLPDEGRASETLGDRGIWQRGYWEHTIRDADDFTAHVNYTHFNPVKHGYVLDPADWPYSSYRVGGV
jgi:putative transposase